MAERPVPEAIARLDLASIADVGARQAIRALLSLVEELAAENQALRAENQPLRDELMRLKGGSGRPKFPRGTASGGSTDYSSEQERRSAPKGWQKRGKQDRLRIDRTERVVVDPATLPADAVFKGYETVVVQDLVLRTDTVAFEQEIWYSPLERRSYRALRPAGYAGTFGPNLRALVLTLAYAGGMSERKLLELVQSAGIVISTGTLSNLLTEGRVAFEPEAQAVLKAGLGSGPWQHLDDTSTRVNGDGQYCHILCNPLYTAYQTTPGKDRLTVIDVLRGGRPRAYRFDQEADRHLVFLGLSAAARAKLVVIPREQALDEATLTALLAAPALRLGPKQQDQVREALALAAYLADPDWPVVRTLVCDDAPQFRAITEELALCWIHEGRHYKQLTPVLPQPRAARADILDQFWTYYRDLLAYREHPTPDERARLDARFDALFGTVTGYHALDRRLALTREKKPELLLVLARPELPLHNNPAELGARQRVRKRDVSFGPRSPAGSAAWDTFMTLAATTRKLGLDFATFLTDRFTQAGQIPPLPDLIAARASQLAHFPA
ncbi:MAG TPA: transposase [Chloroflexota bacterium]|nr:transposase [Chloroflexota bacterium]